MSEVTEEFRKQARYFAESYVLDVYDIEDTYKDKPESLDVLFNADNSRKGCLYFIAAGGAAISTFLAVAGSPFTLIGTLPLSGSIVYGASRKLNQIEQAVRGEVGKHRNAAVPIP